jgi:release factor glutamine methyltransferase
MARAGDARVLADIGTGSGVIATFLARELPEARIYAVDISSDALSVAQRNLERYRVAERVQVLQGNLLEPLPERPDLIVADLPYVSDEQLASNQQRLVRQSPAALLGGPTGLELYARLVEQLRERDWAVALVAEVDSDQAEAMRDLLRASFASGAIQDLPAYRSGARIVVFVPHGASEEESVAPVGADDTTKARFESSGGRHR